MSIRLFAIALATLVIAQLSVAQGSSSGAGDSQQYRLSGVLVSDTRKTALLNGRLVHEGSEVGGAIIESIDAREIQVRFGTTRQRVRIGGSFTAGSAGNEDRSMMVVTRSAPVTERLANASNDKTRSPGVLDDSVGPHKRSVSGPTAVKGESGALPVGHEQHIVASGETLSGIALRYRPDGITINQMMIALFEANPMAFTGNINALSAGATLYIPDSSAASSLTASAAMAEVTRQHQTWREDVAGTTRQLASIAPTADKPANDSYGPVRRGDTLSEIALDLSRAGNDFSSDQLMIALYRSNPHAVGRSIDVVFEGAVLQVPDRAVIASLDPATAKAEVHRQMSIARTGGDEPGVSPDFDVETVVSSEDHELLKAQYW
ncbi:MAG: FimV/HubP family polar landmark protein [Woeseiaceae bacterium]|nr:FimV/HubP family polar landmark protein [Woeseiaceae bacterium]